MTGSDKPLVSVIIPAYNCEAWIGEALDSVLAQTYQNWECIIVDDGSTDNTWAVVQGYASRHQRIRCYRQGNQGPSVARNNAIAHSSGEYILPVDADDRIAPTCIERMVDYIISHSKTTLVYGQVELFGAGQGVWHLPEYNYEDFIWDNSIISSAMFRRSDFDRIGGYNPEMRDGYEDWDFWLSLLKPDSVVHRIDEVLYYYRQTDKSRSTKVETNIPVLNRQLYHNHPDVYEHYAHDIITLRNRLSYYQQQLASTQSGKAYRIGKLITRCIPQCFKKGE